MSTEVIPARNNGFQKRGGGQRFSQRDLSLHDLVASAETIPSPLRLVPSIGSSPNRLPSDYPAFHNFYCPVSRRSERYVLFLDPNSQKGHYQCFHNNRRYIATPEELKKLRKQAELLSQYDGCSL